MKFKKIILVSLFLLILTLGAVSASDDIQDNVTSTQDADIIADDDDDFIEYQEGTGTQNSNLEVNWPSEIKVGEYYPITFNMPGDMETNVSLYVNNERLDDGQVMTNETSYDVYLDEFGTYTLKFKVFGDSKYAPVTKEKKYVVNDYMLDVEIRDKNLTYGQDTEAIITFPSDMEGVIKVNGVSYPIDEEYDNITVPLKNLKIGTNPLQISYTKVDKYPSKSFVVYVDVKAQVVYQQQMTFDNVTFSLNLPSDASGDLEILVDGYIWKSARLVNGKATIKFDGLNLGNHTVSASYTGKDYKCADVDQMLFEVTPRITVNSFKTTKDDNTVEIRLPEFEAGTLNIKAERYTEELPGMPSAEISRVVVVEDGSVVSLSAFEYGEYKYEVTYVSYTGYAYTKFEDGFVRENFDFNITAPDKVLADELDIPIVVTHLSANDATMELYVDGVKYDEGECTGLGFLEFMIGGPLKVGNHKLIFKFLGSDRYLPMEKSVNIESSNMIFDIPEEIVLGSDEEITISTVQDATGNLVVYVDGEVFKTAPIKDGVATVDMSDLSFESHSIEVVYENGNYPDVSESNDMNVSYTFKMTDDPVGYASDDLFTIKIPSDLSKDDLVVLVDDVPYNLISIGNQSGIDLSSLEVGDHNISVSYPGDGKFYPLSVEKNITVNGEIKVPSEIKLDQDNSISLVLPKNPKGTLVLSKYDELNGAYMDVAAFSFATQANNAKAEIPISSYLSVGENNFKIRYSGTDYNIPEAFAAASVSLDVTYEKQVLYGKSVAVTVNLPGAKGVIDVNLDDDYFTKSFNNGVAKITFPSDLEVGLHSFQLLYAEGYLTFDYEGQFVVYPKLTVPTLVIDGDKTVSVRTGDEPVGSILFYENGKKLKEVDLEENGQKISLAFLEKGSHKLTLVYDSWDEVTCTIGTYTINAKKASITGKDKSMSYLDGSAYKVLVKDYKGKAVKKGQSVKFYVDGKLFKTVKTNAKGYASVVFTHAPGTHTIKMVYKATTVTKKLTVKQILTLKKVTVKRSAKKLDLTATLKKVKGKYLKNVQVTFKFNGKTYKTKTNSKGVAKVTIPSNILKKLKVGKTVTYQATYVKATVKQSVKVKK